MARDPKQTPTLSDAGRRDAALRDQRQAAALRENLLRRKAQQRARAAAPSGPADTGLKPNPDPSKPGEG